MNIQQALNDLIHRKDLPEQDMISIMRQVMNGDLTAAQIAGLLVALSMKGETITEITAAAKVMREFVSPVQVESKHLVDIIGTGGDAVNTFNVSTASAIVAAAAGAVVAKQGARSVSGRSGSADVLQAAGVNINLTPEQAAKCLTDINLTFMFAPQYHSAMKHAVAPRKDLGIRNIFNLLSPLTNPAKAPNLLLGVYKAELIEPMAKVCLALGFNQVMVVHAADGLDEISITGETQVAELKSGDIFTYKIRPENYGIPLGPLSDIIVDSTQKSLELIQQVLTAQPGTPLNMVLLNAGCAIYLAGKAKDISGGIDKARAAINNGSARIKLAQLAEATHQFAMKKPVACS